MRSARMTFVVVAIFALSASAASKPPPLQQAKALYESLEYEKCLTKLQAAAKQATAAQDQAQVELYGGLCNFNIGNLEEAGRRFDLGLELDPSLKLPADTSPRIVELFDQSRARAERKLAKQRPPPKVEEPKPVVVKDDAPRETALTPMPRHVDDTEVVTSTDDSDGPSYAAPIALAGVSALSAGAGAYFGLQARGYESQAKSAHFASDTVGFNQQASSAAMYANVGFGVAATAAVGAAIAWFVAD